MNLDVVNGLFEFGMGAAILLSVRRLAVDKVVKGFHWFPLLYATAWGFFNLIYYPSLHQWYSWAGGIFIVSVNLTYLIMVICYRKNS